jgi:hypothetical protein
MTKEDVLKYARQFGKFLIAIVVIAVILIIAGYIFIDSFKIVLVLKVFNYVVQNIVNISGMNTWLAKGLVVLVLIPFIWAIKTIVKIGIFKREKQKKGKIVAQFIVVIYIALFFFSMYFLGRDTYFGHKIGDPTKYYAVTPEGIRFFDSPGFDPVYGKELKPVTPNLIEQYRRSQKGLQPKRISITENTEFFDSITREPKVWYYKDAEGNYDFFDQPGYHPVYWEELAPVTREIIISYRQVAKQKEEERDTLQKAEEEKFREQTELENKRQNIEKNINTLIANDPNKPDIALLIVEKENLSLSQNASLLADLVGQKLAQENCIVTINLFKNAFMTEANIDDLLQVNPNLVFELELRDRADFIVLGLKNATYSQDPRLGDLISCNLDIDLKLISTKTGQTIFSNTFRDAGIGTDNERAEDNAMEKIAIKVGNVLWQKIK